MITALIGHTGFVGGHLSRQARFDEFFHSTDIHEIKGKSFDLIVSAGVASLKWKANREPQADREAIRKLMDALQTVHARTFILMSTIDVYDNPQAVDESSPVKPDRMTPYGRHRWELEEFVRERFNAVIIRLPNLFGEGLKKNIVFDLLHDHNVNQIHQDAVLQWYSLENLWQDIQRILKNKIPLINIATEPWPTRELVKEVFGVKLPKQQSSPAPVYDFRTRYSALWGKSGPYLYSKDEVIKELLHFVKQEQAKSALR